jgi:hypothetical protein
VCAIVGVAIAVAIGVIDVSASVDPWVAWLSAAGLVAAGCMFAWRLVRLQGRLVLVASFAVGAAGGWVVVLALRAGLERDYLVGRCLEANRDACKRVFMDGLPPKADDRARRALVPACGYALPGACYSLLRIDRESACIISASNCTSLSLDAESRDRACDLVSASCGASATPSPDLSGAASSDPAHERP